MYDERGSRYYEYGARRTIKEKKKKPDTRYIVKEDEARGE